MQLTKSQNKAVSKLFNKYLRRHEYKLTSFKAPTGSGKTFMASVLISKIFSEEMDKEKKTIIIFATVSNAELPKQLKKKLDEYKKFHEFNNYEIEYIYSPSAAKSNKLEDIRGFQLEDNKVFVFGTSSFGKNTLFYQNKTLDNFIQDASNQDYQIIFIRDEAHIGSGKELTKSLLDNFDKKVKNCASFIVEMTATPKDPKNVVELTYDDMNDDDVYLLKTRRESSKKTGLEISNEDIIDDAIETFIKTKKDYQKNIKDHIIYPAMLVQVMNDSDYEVDYKKNQDFKEGLELLEKKLNKAGLKYLKYLNSSPQVFGTNVPATLEYASELDSHIDVIIFKVGPATGWDIPRANILLQLRNVSSENLNVQTIGRIMRNPIPTLKKNSITDKYYLYSNYKNPYKEIASYYLQKHFLKKKLFFGKINHYSRQIIKDSLGYENDVIDYINSKDFFKIVTDLHEDKIIFDSMSYGSATVYNKIPNYISLKIYNMQKFSNLEKLYKVSLFEKYLKDVSYKTKKNIEKIKYAFYKFSINKLNEIVISNSTWIRDKDTYVVERNANLPPNYNMFINNEDFIKLDTSSFENYGYFLIKEKDDYEKSQHFDSKPEEIFFREFNSRINSIQRSKINFFAKMPNLGSGIYFEYYHEKKASFKKSFMDFAIEYKNKIIMIEVKSRDEDYDEDKTDSLLIAYEIYMEKYGAMELSLVLYEYDKRDESHNFHLMFKDKWIKNVCFDDALHYLLD